MEQLNENLNELYLNYDTLCDLREDDVSSDEIIEMFKDEIEYPEELTNSLLRIKRSYLKSIVMRLKIKMKKHKPEHIKTDLLKYNSSLEPVLSKLLHCERVAVEHNELEQEMETKKEVVEPVVEVKKPIVKVAKVAKVEDEYHLDEFLDDYVEKTDNKEDVIKVNTIYEYYQEFREDHMEYEEASKKDLKKFLTSKWGKSTKSGYTGYKIIDEE